MWDAAPSAVSMETGRNLSGYTGFGASDSSVAVLQGQFEVSTEQLLIKRREVRSNDVRVNGSERAQLLSVSTAQRTQR